MNKTGEAQHLELNITSTGSESENAPAPSSTNNRVEEKVENTCEVRGKSEPRDENEDQSEKREDTATGGGESETWTPSQPLNIEKGEESEKSAAETEKRQIMT